MACWRRCCSLPSASRRCTPPCRRTRPVRAASPRAAALRLPCGADRDCPCLRPTHPASRPLAPCSGGRALRRVVACGPARAAGLAARRQRARRAGGGARRLFRLGHCRAGGGKSGGHRDGGADEDARKEGVRGRAAAAPRGTRRCGARVPPCVACARVRPPLRPGERAGRKRAVTPSSSFCCGTRQTAAWIGVGLSGSAALNAKKKLEPHCDGGSLRPRWGARARNAVARVWPVTVRVLNNNAFPGSSSAACREHEAAELSAEWTGVRARAACSAAQAAQICRYLPARSIRCASLHSRCSQQLLLCAQSAPITVLSTAWCVTVRR